MASTIVKRSVLVRGHKTSVSLEEPFWNGLKDIAASRRQRLTAVLQQIDLDRQDNRNLSSAVRLFVLDHYRDQAQAAAKPENGARPRQSSVPAIWACTAERPSAAGTRSRP